MTPEKLTNAQIERRIQLAIVGPALDRMGGTDSFLREGWSFDRVHELVIEPTYSVTVEEDCDLGDTKEGPILGAFDPIANIARIDRRISRGSSDPRRTFVLWHEVAGHGVLQGGWLRNQGISNGSNLIDTDLTLSDECRRVLERQANHAAACAAAPIHLVKLAIVHAFRPTNRLLEFKGKAHYGFRPGRWQPEIESFQDFKRFIAAQIQPHFDSLSVECLSYRVEASGLVVDRSQTMPPTVQLFRVGPPARSAGVPRFGVETSESMRNARAWPSHQNKQRSA